MFLLFVLGLELLHGRAGNSRLIVYCLLESLRKMRNRQNPNKVKDCISDCILGREEELME